MDNCCKPKMQAVVCNTSTTRKESHTLMMWLFCSEAKKASALNAMPYTVRLDWTDAFLVKTRLVCGVDRSIVVRKLEG